MDHSTTRLEDALAAKSHVREARGFLRQASSELLQEIDSLLGVAELRIDRLIALVRQGVA
ncbi:hypothetical protein Amn_pb01140 (plasmid) [Aminobacter sp. Y103A]|nr:hypothetical protein Amn_pb01140 [Aminobacter sp. SS-2016]